MLKTELYPYQKEGVRVLRDRDGTALLADEVGLGKTLQSLYYCWRYLPRDEGGPIVVVVPAHLKTVWKRQAQQHLELRAEVLFHERVPADRLPPLDPDGVLVINYDILTPDDWKAGTPPPERAWVRWLADLKPRLLICDEAHVLSNPDSQRTRAVRWLARRVPRRLVLTGTPMANKPGDLWSLLNILWPDRFPSRFEFGSEYANPKKVHGRWTYPGAKNLDRLHRVLTEECGMVRRRKQDVLKDLPAISYDVVPIDCDLREYRKAEEDLARWLAETSALASERARENAALTKLTALVQLAAKAKLDQVVRWVRDFLAEGEGKLLLGAIHYRVTGPLMSALGKRGVLVDGTMSAKKKDAAFDRFNQDPDCRVLVGNVHAAGTGWSCTSTSDGALCEIPWRPSDVEQFAGRIHGVGRGLAGRPAQMRLLVATGTIEEKQCELIQRKMGWANMAVDGVAGAEGMDLKDQLLAYVSRESA